MENLIWDSFSSGVHHLYVSMCRRCHMLVVVWDVQSIQGCGYDCNVICISWGMVQFCCIGSLFVQFGVLKFVLNFQISVLLFIVRWVYCGAVYLLFMDAKKVCVSGGRQVLCHVCIEFNTLIKLVSRSQWPHSLRRRSTAARMLRSWVRIPLGAGCLSVVSIVCCQVEVSATSWSLVQRSPTDCGVSLSVI